MFYRLCKFFLLLTFISLSAPLAQCRQAVPDEQLKLFHWWNVCPDDQTYGPDASRLPVHEGGFVDGRSGFQWIKAVISYLDYRAGSGWRPGTHRYHPIR